MSDRDRRPVCGVALCAGGSAAHHPNIELMRANTQAYVEGNVAAVANAYSLEVVWYWAGDHRLKGDYRGWEALFALLAEADKQIDSKLELVDAAAIGEEIVICDYRMFGRIGTADIVNEDVAMLFRLRDGKIVSGVEMYPSVADAAFREAPSSADQSDADQSLARNGLTSARSSSERCMTSV